MPPLHRRSSRRGVRLIKHRDSFTVYLTINLWPVNKKWLKKGPENERKMMYPDIIHYEDCINKITDA
jgi:hypothetical protein